MSLYPIGSTVTFANIFSIQGFNFGVEYLKNLFVTVMSTRDTLFKNILEDGSNSDRMSIKLHNGVETMTFRSVQQFHEHLEGMSTRIVVQDAYKAGGVKASCTFLLLNVDNNHVQPGIGFLEGMKSVSNMEKIVITLVV